MKLDAATLRWAAEEADRRDDIGRPYGPSASQWLRSLAATAERDGGDNADASAPDLTPFRQLHEELRLRGMRFGGGTGEAFRAAASLTESALAQYEVTT